MTVAVSKASLWAVLGVLLTGLITLGAALYAYGHLRGELTLVVVWAQNADKKLLQLETDIATNGQRLDSVQAILQGVFIDNLTARAPAPQSRPARPWDPWPAAPSIEPID